MNFHGVWGIHKFCFRNHNDVLGTQIVVMGNHKVGLDFTRLTTKLLLANEIVFENRKVVLGIHKVVLGIYLVVLENHIRIRESQNRFGNSHTRFGNSQKRIGDYEFLVLDLKQLQHNK